MIEVQNGLKSFRSFDQANERVASVPGQIGACAIENISVWQVYELKSLLFELVLNRFDIVCGQRVVIVDTGCDEVFSGRAKFVYRATRYAAVKHAFQVDGDKSRQTGICGYTRAKIHRQRRIEENKPLKRLARLSFYGRKAISLKEFKTPIEPCAVPKSAAENRDAESGQQKMAESRVHKGFLSSSGMIGSFSGPGVDSTVSDASNTPIESQTNPAHSQVARLPILLSYETQGPPTLALQPKAAFLQ